MASNLMCVSMKTIIFFSIICYSIQTETNKHDLDFKRRVFLIVRTLQNDPVIYGFRAESSKYPVSIDDDLGLTVIPDKTVITLRLFGNNLISDNNQQKIRIGFTATEGTAGQPCDPDHEFTVHKIINKHMALVQVKLSETIRDNPYSLCYGVSDSNYFSNRYITDSHLNSEQLFSAKPMKYYYISGDDALKVRVIGRQLAIGYRGKDVNRDMNTKMILARILDEVNKIHRLTDEMQDWTAN